MSGVTDRPRRGLGAVKGCMLIATLLLTLAAHAGPETLGWEKLQRGMSPEEVAGAVGAPILRNAARGHETWIYEAGADAQFQSGVLVAWTAPRVAPTNTTPRPSDASKAPRASNPSRANP